LFLERNQQKRNRKELCYLLGFGCGVLSVLALIAIDSSLLSYFPSTLLALIAIGSLVWVFYTDESEEDAEQSV